MLAEFQNHKHICSLDGLIARLLIIVVVIHQITTVPTSAVLLNQSKPSPISQSKGSSTANLNTLLGDFGFLNGSLIFHEYAA